MMNTNDLSEKKKEINNKYNMDSSNVNKQCMDKILMHLTKLICMTEFEEVKYLNKLVDMSTSISAQLLAIDGKENNIKEIQ